MEVNDINDGDIFLFTWIYRRESTMKIIEGSIEELIKYMEWVEAHDRPTKSSLLEDLMAKDANASA